MERVSTEGWREAGAAFVGCVTRLLERLLDYRAVMQGAEHRDKRMAATVNLLVMSATPTRTLFHAHSNNLTCYLLLHLLRPAPDKNK